MSTNPFAALYLTPEGYGNIDGYSYLCFSNGVTLQIIDLGGRDNKASNRPNATFKLFIPYAQAAEIVAEIQSLLKDFNINPLGEEVPDLMPRGVQCLAFVCDPTTAMQKLIKECARGCCKEQMGLPADLRNNAEKIIATLHAAATL